MDLNKIESTRRQLAALFNRAKQLDANAVKQSTNATHVLFAQAVAQQVLSLIPNACERLGILPIMLQEPISEYHDMYLEAHWSKTCDESGVTVGQMTEANIAYAMRLVTVQNDQLNHAEACLDGEMTMDGQPIRHGALWYK